MCNKTLEAKDAMDKIINLRTRKIHYLKTDRSTLCHYSVEGVKEDGSMLWQETSKEVDCRSCIQKFNREYERIHPLKFIDKGTVISLSTGELATVVVDDPKKYKNIIIVQTKENTLRVIDRETRTMARPKTEW